MNPQLVQALMQTLQQAMQLIQQASGAQADPTQNPAMAGAGANGADAAVGDDDDDPDYDASLDDDDDGGGEGDDDDDGGSMNGGGAGSLHDRISKLESHTGLKKSANNVPVLQRLDALEMQWLGEEYEGPVVSRVQQLEKAAGLAKARQSTSTARTAVTASDAPDTIPLDALIKTAITEGIAQGMREMAKQQTPQTQVDELPPVQTMRKNAATRNGNPHYNRRRAQTQAVQADAELVKAAQAWGYEESELDQPVGLGDVLLAQYHANATGMAYLPGAGDDLGDDDQ